MRSFFWGRGGDGGVWLGQGLVSVRCDYGILHVFI